MLNKLIVVDTRTGEQHTLAEVQEITDCEFDDDQLKEAYENLTKSIEISVEICKLEENLLYEEPEKTVKPNPIYIPKHVAHRKKRGR